jgi:hypothetical protein
MKGKQWLRLQCSYIPETQGYPAYCIGVNGLFWDTTLQRHPQAQEIQLLNEISVGKVDERT